MDGEMLCHKGNTAQSSIGSHMKLCPDFDSFHSTQSTSAKKPVVRAQLFSGFAFAELCGAALMKAQLPAIARTMIIIPICFCRYVDSHGNEIAEGRKTL